MDFVGDFLESPTEVSIADSLGFVIDANADKEYIEVDEASVALAAAEVIAAIIGRPASDMPEELSATIEKMNFEVTQKLISKARMAVSIILRKSELQELWAEAGETNEWEQAQSSLLARLS